MAVGAAEVAGSRGAVRVCGCGLENSITETHIKVEFLSPPLLQYTIVWAEAAAVDASQR